MSLKGDCHELDVSPNLDLLVTFGMFVESFIRNFTISSYLICCD
jgi:hypothetical protein